MKEPDPIRQVLAEAGWRPDRQVAVDPRVPTNHPAYAILQQFGGLKLRQVGEGEECAACGINMCLVDYNVISDLESWPELQKIKLVGIGEVDHGHSVLFIDGLGRCFGASTIHDAVYFEGASFFEAVEGIILGRRARPMLHPQKHEVGLYGEVYTRGHPGLYCLA